MEGFAKREAFERRELVGPGETLRPLYRVPHFVGYLLDRDSYAGLHVVLGLLLAGKALALYAILRAVVPEAPAWAFATAALYLFFPGDSGLWNLRCLSHQGATLAFMLAAWALCLHVRRPRLDLALIAGSALACSLLVYEAGYLLAAAAPLAMVFVARERRRPGWWRSFLPWYAGMLLALGVVGLTSLVVVRNPGDLLGYERSLLDWGAGPWVMAKSLAQPLRMLFWRGWLDSARVAASGTISVPLAAAAGVLVTGTTWLLGHEQQVGISGAGRRWIGLGLMVIVMGFLPFVPTVARFDAFRVFTFSAAGAALVATTLLFGFWRSQGRSRAWISVAVGVLAGLGTANALGQHAAFLERSLRQQGIVAGVVARVPAARPGTVFWLLPEEGDRPPAFVGGRQLGFALGFLYSDFSLKATQCRPDGSEQRRPGWARERCEFGADTLSVFQGGRLVGRWRYHSVIGLSADGGRVALMDHLPSQVPATGYSPRALVLAGEPPPRRARTAFKRTPRVPDE